MSGWFGRGPSFVFGPRQFPFQRLSSRNEAGYQGSVSDVAIVPSDPRTMYVVQRGWWAGSAMFRTRDGGRTWDCVSEIPSHPVDFSCVAVDPTMPNIVYGGTLADGHVYRSVDGGAHWYAVGNPVGPVARLAVDPRGNGQVYATTKRELFVLHRVDVPDDPLPEEQWTSVLQATAVDTDPYFFTSFAMHVSSRGTYFYAGVYKRGVFRSTDPLGAWELLNDGVRLPQYAPRGLSSNPLADGNFTKPYVMVAPRNPDRVYALLVTSARELGLYTSGDPLAADAWDMRAIPDVRDTNRAGLMPLGIAPNSAGDGEHDILIGGYAELFRTIDSGHSWTPYYGGQLLHRDHGVLIFSPGPADYYPDAADGLTTEIPAAFFGCDGGLGRSMGAADPAYAVDHANVGDDPLYQAGAVVEPSSFVQNLNRGRSSNAGSGYGTSPQLCGIGYLTSQDTGVSVGGGAPGDWRAVQSGDMQQIAALPQSDGVRIWFAQYSTQWWLNTAVDQGAFLPGQRPVQLGAGGPQLYSPAASNLVALPAVGVCVTGVAQADDRHRIATEAVTAGPGQQVVLSDASGVAVGVSLTFAATPTAAAETVTVLDIVPIVGGAATITANFAHDHDADVAVTLERRFIVEIRDSTASRISQYLPDVVARVGVSPTDPEQMAAIVAGQPWLRTSTATDGIADWERVTDQQPVDIGAGRYLTGIAYDAGGDLLMLVNASLDPIGGAAATPLYTISGRQWDPLPSDDPAAWSGNYYNLVAHPVVPHTFYATHNDSVYEITLDQGRYQWRDLSQTAPSAPATDGTGIYDLAVVNIGTPDAPVVLLYALFAARGVWECDVSVPGSSAGVVGPAAYFRDHILDHPRLGRTQEGMNNPFRPTRRLFHYQSPDIKVDARNNPSGAAPYYQTDPERTITPTRPLDPVSFSELNDFSQNLPANDRANVHVQVQSRSATPTAGLSVWVLWCSAAAGLPALNATTDSTTFSGFWDQFQATGDILPALPGNAAWQPVGPPQPIDTLDASGPQVVTFADWATPLLGLTDPGHYCLIAFVHGAGALRLRPTGYVVDEIVPVSKQIGQKNLHVVAAWLPLTASPRDVETDYTGGASRTEYIEFHNPFDTAHTFDFAFDLRELPREVLTSARFSVLRTSQPIDTAFHNATPRPSSLLGRLASRLPSALRASWLVAVATQLLRRLEAMLGVSAVDSRRPSVSQLPMATSTFDVTSGVEAVLTGVELPAYGRAAAELTFRLTAPIGDADYQVEVQQVQKNRVLGGSSYALTIGAGSHQLRQDQSMGADEPDGWPYGRGRKFTGIRSRLEVYEKGEAN